MFENLETYYEYLETDNGLLCDFNLSKKIVILRDKTEDKELKSQCSYELFFSDFTIENGVLKPQLTYTNGQEYPNLTLFEDDFKHIKSRAENVKNPKYKAKYNHLLWCSGLKHNDYAKQAIDNYFSFLKSVFIPLDENLSHRTFGDYFKNLFILSQTINYKKEDVLQFLISILGIKKINGYKEHSLMKFIAEEGKKIDTTIFQSFFNYSNKIINDSIYPDFVGEYLELLINLCSKLNISPKPYHNKLAEFHISKSEKKEESFVIHDFYLKALAQYKLAGNKEKIEEVTILVEKAKRTINFKSIKVEHTNERLQSLWETIIKVTDEITEKGESKDIYQYIMFAPNIFPKAETLNENIRPVMFDFVSVMTFDINKNVSKKERSGINPYFLYIQNFSIQHLWLVFSKGIKNGKISFESLIDFLKNHSWYGQDYTFIDADDEIEGFNWIELLSPSLLSFFTQSEIDIKLNKNNNQGYILAIDSLVIKFEGLLREFSRNIGAQTIEIKDNGTEERISFEKLLENQKIKELIPKDDIALLKFIFTSEGLNLRNNIAHCFYQTKNYLPATMFLLIAALLKLGNYKFKPKE
jgi:hypothetical protein